MFIINYQCFLPLTHVKSITKKRKRKDKNKKKKMLVKLAKWFFEEKKNARRDRMCFATSQERLVSIFAKIEFFLS